MDIIYKRQLQKERTRKLADARVLLVHPNSNSKSRKTGRNFAIASILSILVIFSLSGLQHFLYQWTSSNFVALFAPVNESVWEHTKLIFYPTIVFWFCQYLAFRKTTDFGLSNWILGAALSSVVGIYLVLSNYYLFFKGFSVPESLPVHLVIELIAIIAGQSFGYWALLKMRENKKIGILSLFIILTLTAIFCVFSFLPPSAEMFIPPSP